MSDRTTAPGESGTDASRATADTFAGNRLVIGLYIVVVGFAAFIGFVLGLIAPRGLDPRLFGLIALPPTPLGMAAYGAVTLATLLGVLLLAVVYVSRRYDDAEPRA